MTPARLIIFFSFFLICCRDSRSTQENLEQDSFVIELEFIGPKVDPKTVYVAWVEDEKGKNLQNLYVCNSLAKKDSLLGTALPYWQREKRPGSTVDGVTGASKQQSNTIRRSLNFKETNIIRIGFEIDRSKNENVYFFDRPSFIYKSELIDLDNLKKQYSLNLEGYMANDTSLPEHYSQAPKDPKNHSVPGFEPWKLMTDLNYIAPFDDMVNSLIVRIKSAH